MKNKLHHHSAKTKLTYVGSNHSLAKIDDEFPVMINDQPIPRVHSISCLGVKLDETLNWEEHIDMVCKKVGTGVGILRRIKPYVPANILISIYDVLRSLDWENLETRWYSAKATFLYKVSNDSAAPTLKDSFIDRNISQNNYNLRNSQTDLSLPKPNREFLKISFKYSVAYLWNNLPLEAQQAHSISLFKRYIKQNI